MTLWSAKDAASATGGAAYGDWAVNGVSIDTRSIGTGDLFVPLKDARDGHDFIPMALEKGAVVMSERSISDVPSLKVNNAMDALRGLAVASRKRSKAIRIAVTGSVGKTSVKEALAIALAPSGATHKSIKSFNNHWGVPLMMAAMPKITKFAVFEAGMNHAGELTDLSSLIQPDIAIITKIAPAHLEFFASVDKIAEAKSEIFDGMSKGGIAVLNSDDNYFEFLSTRAKAKGLTVIGVSAKDFAGQLALSGDHHRMNAALVMATVKAAGGNVGKAKTALSKMGAVTGRGATFKARLAGKSITVIDESYNANPVSMDAAIKAVSGPGRRIAVLGDMLELGARSAELHGALAKTLVDAKYDKVITVGEQSRALANALPKDNHAAHVTNKDGVIAALKTIIKNNDRVLFKASNSVGLGTIIQNLRGEKS